MLANRNKLKKRQLRRALDAINAVEYLLGEDRKNIAKMPNCNLQIVKGITADDIKTCVSSYTSSLRYIKKIVPLTIYNIVYNRVNFNENLFKERTVCSIPFKTFKSGVKNHILADVFYWIKGIIDAIGKKQVKEMHLLFRNNMSNLVVEDYKFTFCYQDEPSPGQFPESKDVIETTRRLFSSIESLSKFKKLNEDIGIFIEAILTDENVLEDYNPPCFVRFDSDEPLFFETSQGAQYDTIGYLKTGYHKMKCSFKGALSDDECISSSVVVDDKSEHLHPSIVEDADENNDEPKAKKAKVDVGNISLVDDELISLHSTINDEAEEANTVSSEKKDVHCPCNINAVIGPRQIIKCTICFKYQHLLCVGCTDLLSLKGPYICVYCHSKETECFDVYLHSNEQSNWEFICGIRLVFSECYYYGKEHIHLLEKMNQTISSRIIKLIKQNKIISFCSQNKSYINKNALVPFMTKIFRDFHLPATMDLNETNEYVDISD